MPPNVISFREHLDGIDEHWAPKTVAQMNDYDFKLAKLQGEFVWHQHTATDEAFIVLRGDLVIEFREGTATMNAGEMLVVPAGVEHRPVAAVECHVLLVELAGTRPTGDTSASRRQVSSPADGAPDCRE